MKNKLFELFVCILLVGTFFVVTSDTVRGPQDGDYTYTMSNGEATITGYTGAGGAVVIPSTLGGYPTVHIGDHAFDNDNGRFITSVIIPNSVTTIGDSAFYWCLSLASVTISNSVTTIGELAFHHCPPLITVTIPNSVTTIGMGAFSGDTSLASVTIGNSVTTIAASMFEGCSSLTSVTFGNSVTSIGGGAFQRCSSLASITIPNSVTSIGSSVFEGCTSLTSAIIGSGLTSIGTGMFISCVSLVAFNVSASNMNYASVDGVLYDKAVITLIQWPLGKTPFNIPNSITSIGIGAFSTCTLLTSITIPNNVTTIGDSAFSDCTNLISVIIGNSVATIGDYAFGACSSLTSVIIGNSVTTIGGAAFQSCSALTSVNIPNSVTTIGQWAFMGCYSLISMTIPNSVTNIGTEAFIGCTSLISVIIGNGITSIGNSVFEGCTSLKSLIIGNNVNAIGKGAFAGCTSLVSVNFPDSVTRIGSYAFWFCTSLTYVNIPDSVIYLDKGAFGYCSSLISVTIGNGVISISDDMGPEGTFQYCTSLTSVIIGNSVTIIGANTFLQCPALTSITFVGLVAPTYVDGNWIAGTPPAEIRGHAYAASNFPAPGNVWNGLTMGSYIEQNQPTIANFTYTPLNLTNTTIIHFTDTSTDADGTIISRFWNFGDHYYSDLQNPIHCYYIHGVYTVTLTVTDNEGKTNMISRILFINTPPLSPTIPSGPATRLIGQTGNYSTSTIDPDNDHVQYRFDWNASGSHDISSWTTLGASGHIDSLSHSWNALGTYSVKVQARDQYGFESGWSNGFTVTISTGTQTLDQQQTQFNTNYAVYTSRWGGQSFIPTLGSLTSVQLYMRKTGSPPSDVVLSVRSSLTGSDLVSLSKPASQIPTSNSWIWFNFSALTVTPGNTYYLVLRTTSGSTTNCYSWGYGSSTPYTNGMLSTSSDSGITWHQYTQYDFCFKTYGMSAPSTPVLSFTPSSYNFGNVSQGATGSTNLEIWNSGTGTLTYSLSESSNWVSVTPTSGSSSGEHDTITVSINMTGLSPGLYTCPISISSNGGSGTFTVEVTVIGQPPSEVLDQQQTQYNTNYAVYLARWGGQSFIPTLGSLTSAQLYMRKIGSPPGDVVLSIRSSLTGADLVSLSKPASQIPTSIGWVTFDLADLTVTSGNTYYLVLKTTGGDSTNCYYWGYGSGTSYTNGALWTSSDSGITWHQYTQYDFCFKTYGM